jgi:hypothetical protein
MPHKALTIAICAALAGCAGPRFDPEFYAAMSNDELCSAYGSENFTVLEPGPGAFERPLAVDAREVARNEIERRQLVPPGDWPLIERGKINFGMHRCSVLAAWQAPASIARSRSYNVPVETWLYNDNNGNTYKSVMLTNNTVTWLSFNF